LVNKKHAVLIDGTHNFTIANYYIFPEEQVNQLSELGFKDVKIFSVNYGIEMEADFDVKAEPWFYYLCTP
jgi:hypothetical protein